MSKNTAPTVSAREFIVKTGYAPSYVYIQLATGRIEAEKKDGRYRIPLAEMGKWEQRREANAG